MMNFSISAANSSDADVLVPITQKKNKDPKLLEAVIQMMPRDSKFISKMNTIHK